jgi:hypothetical protein
VTEREELIQDEPPTVADVVALIDGCVNDVKRLNGKSRSREVPELAIAGLSPRASQHGGADRL